MNPVTTFFARVLLGGMIATAMGCSDGALDDNYDHYMNRFGLSLTEPGDHKGAILGKALLADGSAASWAKVYARGPGDGPAQVGNAPTTEPFTMSTNEKGGFYLGDLNPGAYRLYVVSPGGQGVTMDVNVAAGQVSEFEGISLSSLRRLSGHATLEHEEVHTGIVVYVPGTPFSAFTDNEGYYYLDVPAGSYGIRAERDTFAPYDSGIIEIAEDRTLDITLAPNPWPNGRVLVDAPHHFLVRGRTTKLKIEPVSGVRYMRLRKVVDQTLVPIKQLGRWTAIKEGLELTSKNDGLTMLMFEFMDAYGKTSEPVYVQYYNTSLDNSWSIMYGEIKAPVVIKRGEKVAFIDGSDMNIHLKAGDDTVSGNDSADDQAPVQPSSGDVVGGSGLGSDDDETDGTVAYPTGHSYSVSTTFRNDVTIERGAKIRGGARFLGDLNVNGTAAEPVTWTALSNDEDLWMVVDARSRTRMLYAKIDHALLLRADANSDMALEHVELQNFSMIQSYYGWFQPSGRQNQVYIRNSKVNAGFMQVSCDKTGLDGTTDGSSDDTSGGERWRAPAPDRIGFSIVDSEINEAMLSLECTNTLNQLAVDLNLERNDLLATFDQSFYLTGLPAQTAINYTVVENHFRLPERLHPGVAADGWPAWFGENRATPWNHFGTTR